MDHPLHLTRALGLATFLAAAVVTASCLYAAWLSRGVLDGESASVLSISVAFAQTGQLTYPLYEFFHELFGFTQTVVHPPLHYALGGAIISLFGAAPLQYTAASVGVAAIGLGLVGALCLRLYGWAVAGLGLMLIMELRVFYDPATGGRPDVLLGLCYLVTVLACSVVLFCTQAICRRVAALVAGFFAVVSVAAHYYGIMVLGLAPVVAAALVWRHGTRALPDVALAGGGAGVAMAIWYAAYGDELWRLVPMVAMVADVIGERLFIPFSAFLAGVTVHSGGVAIITGLGLMAAYLTVRLVQAARGDSWRALESWFGFESFFFFAACWPIAFLFFFTINHNYRYWIDFIFVAAVASAGGYFHAFNWLARLAKLPIDGFRTAAAALGVLLIALLSSSIGAYFSPNPTTLRSPNALHSEIRTGLLSFMPEQGPVVMGSPAFQFLPDRPVVSSMDLVLGQLFGRDQNSLGLDEARARYREVMRSYPRHLPKPRQLQSAALERAVYMVVGEECHFWSCLFFAPEAWHPGFRRVGSVVIFRNNLTGLPNPTLRSVPRVLTVFMRRNDADRAAAFLPVDGSLRQAQNTGLLLYPASAVGGASEEVWRQASPEGRLSQVEAFLAAAEWFGLRPSPAQQRGLVKALIGPIDAAFTLVGVRDLAGAFEVAMSDEANWRLVAAQERPWASPPAQETAPPL